MDGAGETALHKGDAPPQEAVRMRLHHFLKFCYAIDDVEENRV